MSDPCLPATVDDMRALVETLVDGFHDDPLYAWLYPEAGERPRLLRESFEQILGYGLPQGHLYTDAGRDAVALWSAPGVELLGAAQGEAYLRLLRTQIGDRVVDVTAGMAATTAHHPAEPHFTLHVVAVRRGAQGHGVGAALLAPVLDRCDADGLLACLDSSTIRNVPFYERLGFEVTAETHLPGDSVTMRSMVRIPRS